MRFLSGIRLMTNCDHYVLECRNNFVVYYKVIIKSVAEIIAVVIAETVAEAVIIISVCSIIKQLESVEYCWISASEADKKWLSKRLLIDC